MSNVDSSTAGNVNSDPEAGPDAIAEQLDILSAQLRRTVCVGAEQGESLDQVERHVWQSVQEIGFKAVQLFGSLQGDGDHGETVDTEEGNTLRRAMLNVRAAFQSDHWDAFLSSRSEEEVMDRIHPHRTLLSDYTPLQLAC